MRFYAADLSAYNNGRLHGAWIEASDDVETMQKAIDAMLKASPEHDAEEYAIHDSEGLGDIGEHAGLQAIADFVSFHAECEAAGLGDIASLMKGDDLYPSDYAGKGDNLAAWCEEFMDETGGLDAIPENIRFYFNYEAYGRDMELGGDIETIRHGGELYVFWSR